MLLFFLLVVPLANGDRIVTTNSGPVRGTLVKEKVEAFLGIPFAEPPVGDLRFRRPVPKTPWEETYEANKLPPSCIQFRLTAYYAPDPSAEMSEDCLYLNLWVPRGGRHPKPIMLFIYGGSFILGSTNMKLYDGTNLSEHGDVIVATMNYRLGTLGFFSGFIEKAEGSMGLYDQVMAIQWIKDNAKHFGGDPDNIVLFGESSGSVSVSLHMVSPMSKDLFKRGILQSGSSYLPFYSNANTLLRTGSEAAASALGCAKSDDWMDKNPEEVVECLKLVPAERFPEADLRFLESSVLIVPAIGSDFLPETPIELYKKGNFKSGEVLIGINKNEGSLLLVDPRPELFGARGERAESIVFNDTSFLEMAKNVTRITDWGDDIFQSYLDRVKNSKKYTYLDALSDIVGDYVINCGAVFQADYQSKENMPTYFYMFAYRPHSTVYAKWMGVTHFEEIQYVFGNPMYEEFTKHEKVLVKDMMDMWVAFAKTGYPRTSSGIKWPRYTVKAPKYLRIGRTDRVKVRPDNYRCEVWEKYFQ